MSLKGIAQENLRIYESGFYEVDGLSISIKESLEKSLANTKLYRPSELELSLEVAIAAPLSFTVCNEKTDEGGKRLLDEGFGEVCILNFASAKNPGGGFLNGAKAQEEDLARHSALVPSLLTQMEYYEANRACGSMLYTDHMIYSPGVPFFRDGDRNFLPEPFNLNVITAPAPNAGQALRRDPNAQDSIEEALKHRATLVLELAKAQKQRNLVLGAWGCGVFRNDPVFVAATFRELLKRPNLAKAFDRVHFAVLDKSKGQNTIRAFEDVFGDSIRGDDG